MTGALARAWVLADSVSAGRELTTMAHQVARRVEAFVVGEGGWADECGRHGASAVFRIDCGQALAGEAAAAVMLEAARRRPPDLALFPVTADGRDAAGRLSAALDAPVVVNVRSLALEGGSLVASSSPPWGPSVVRTAFVGAGPRLVTVRPRSVEPVAVPGGTGEVVDLPVPGGTANRARVVARHHEPGTGPSLEEASVVVAGGRGVGSARTFALVEELARVLGGAAGASRAAVDAGWVPHVAQIGQTGRSVAPEAYLAFGISGASHHLVGIERARRVVAVNTDRHAPIFGVADLGVVGDAASLLERLVAALRPPDGA